MPQAITPPITVVSTALNLFICQKSFFLPSIYVSLRAPVTSNNIWAPSFTFEPSVCILLDSFFMPFFHHQLSSNVQQIDPQKLEICQTETFSQHNQNNFQSLKTGPLSCPRLFRFCTLNQRMHTKCVSTSNLRQPPRL